MVNLNFDKFRKVQKEHKGEYLGATKRQNPGINDEDYNNQDDTEKSPGAAGRDI